MKKPKIEQLKDDYALNTGKVWMCSYGGVCARGESPEAALNELERHFKWLKGSVVNNETNYRMS